MDFTEQLDFDRSDVIFEYATYSVFPGEFNCTPTIGKQYPNLAMEFLKFR
jgi:hypothetical protein